MSATKSDPSYMAGTEGTGDYKVVARTNNGRVGYRVLRFGDFTRVRIEPTPEGLQVLLQHFLVKDGWKQPGEDGQNRFSKVVSNKERDKVVAMAVKALGVSPHRRASRKLVVAGLALTTVAAAVIYWLSR